MSAEQFDEAVKMSVKKNAARELGDELGEMLTNLEKARLLTGDLTTGYFSKIDIHKKENTAMILYEFRRYALVADMAFDYVFKTLGAVSQLFDMANEEVKLL